MPNSIGLNIRFAFSSNAFRGFSLVETIEEIGRIGYKGIEIMADRPHAYPPDIDSVQIHQILDALNRWEMEISNINAFMMTAVGDFHHPSWIEMDRERREMRIQHTIDSIHLASRLRAGSISTEPGGPKDNRMREEDALEIFAEGINRVERHAAEEGIYILIEPEPGLLIETSMQMKRFFSMVESDWVQLNCDLGHFYCAGEDPAEVTIEMKEWIKHIHLEDISSDRIHEHLMLGRGGMDIAGILKTIQEISYKGFVTVELYPYQRDPIGTARQTYKYLNSLKRL